MSAIALGVVRLWELIRSARERGASDLHLRAGEPPVLRINGALIRLETESTTEDELAAFLGDLPGDGSVLRHAEHGALRVHAFRSLGRTHLAVRLLARRIPPFERSTMPAVLQSLAQRQTGLLLFVGPTGCGKSTSLAMLLDYINRTMRRHIITIEDPVEYRHASQNSIIAHRELGADVPDYACALRDCLRSDPDVILVGELRDPQTMLAALNAAETGHLVLSTLHTGDAPQTVDRMLDALAAEARGIGRAQLAQTLLAVVSQRLLPRADGNGRLAAAEVLVATDAVRTLVRDGKVHQLRNAIQTGRNAGMQTLEAHLGELLARREITLEAARAASDRPDEIRLPESAA